MPDAAETSRTATSSRAARDEGRSGGRPLLAPVAEGATLLLATTACGGVVEELEMETIPARVRPGAVRSLVKAALEVAPLQRLGRRRPQAGGRQKERR